MTNMTTNYPHKVTTIKIGRDTIKVSSVAYTLNDITLDETCVFFVRANGTETSMVRGAYADHDKIVEELTHC